MLHSRICFRKLVMDDLPVIHKWLNNAPEVRKHYAHDMETSYETVVGKYGPRLRGEEPITPYMIIFGDVPIGYVQTYFWRDYPDYAQHLNLQEEAASLDIFIGNEIYIHRGLGCSIIWAFLQDIVFINDDVHSCVVTPEETNTSALRAYEKVGFKCVRVIEHPDEFGRVCLMRIGREEFVRDTVSNTEDDNVLKSKFEL